MTQLKLCASVCLFRRVSPILSPVYRPPHSVHCPFFYYQIQFFSRIRMYRVSFGHVTVVLPLFVCAFALSRGLCEIAIGVFSSFERTVSDHWISIWSIERFTSTRCLPRCWLHVGWASPYLPSWGVATLNSQWVEPICRTARCR